jgi:hypothetical protein
MQHLEALSGAVGAAGVDGKQWRCHQVHAKPEEGDGMQGPHVSQCERRAKAVAQKGGGLVRRPSGLGYIQRKIQIVLDFKFKLDFGIWQDTRNLYKDI